MPHYSEKSIFPMQGGCPCGYVRYQVNQAPLLVHCCHCTSCQRELGTAFAINAIIESDQLELLPPAQPTIPGTKGAPGGALAGFNATFARLTFSDTTCGPVVLKTENAEPQATANANANRDMETSTVELVTLPTESSVGMTVAQCSACHSGLWAHYADAGPHTTYLRAGTLDAAHEINPDVHIFTRSKRGFISLADGKPQFESYYKERAGFIRDDCKARYAALEEKTGTYMAELRAALGK
ncbi:glutathione-dependent formaldehyde-activating [Metarhizium acridum CQMa 102]|uniref:Glutathione-dependent formaldehyde-activating n=1 Tax=Metarhizium acridum (strain CQMa 102) TaxID=655827 RepID=E9E612_METAQ|nr:glutathione-dependent formaldehyde-activating [Metarhizium acridum CQMa 102]EFY88692.1 glutathione-dependent formaldehyde-activating [Metarhizium acridum CQMa 102]